MAASTWKGFITFGLISVPIRLFAAARYSHIRFHEVHRKCGNRVHQQLYCPYNDTECRCGEFCITSIWSTPKNPANHSRQLRRVVDNCAARNRIAEAAKGEIDLE